MIHDVSYAFFLNKIWAHVLRRRETVAQGAEELRRRDSRCSGRCLQLEGVCYRVLCWFSCFPPNRLADLMSLCRWPKKTVFFFFRQAGTGRFSIISRIWEGDEWQGNKLVFFSINPHLTTPTRHVTVGITGSRIVYFLKRFLDLPSYFDLSECMLL